MHYEVRAWQRACGWSRLVYRCCGWSRLLWLELCCHAGALLRFECISLCSSAHLHQFCVPFILGSTLLLKLASERLKQPQHGPRA